MKKGFTLNEIFNAKLTENGDLAFKKVSDDNMINILFGTEFYQNHLEDTPKLDSSDKAKLFARFIRDPRFGLGRRDLGRHLMNMTNCSFDEILNSGRADDLWYNIQSLPLEKQKEILDYLYIQIQYKDDNLIRKWMPRYSSKNLMIARYIAKMWKMNKQTYGKFIKCDTTENKLSSHNEDAIQFEQVPSLAAIKYAKAFATKESTKDRYAKYLEDVKTGKKDMKISTVTVYDIYKNADKIDADLLFSKIEKISINAIPIVDTSGSMMCNDAIGKALAIGHYLAKCSTYAPNKVITFSSNPELITLGDNYANNDRFIYAEVHLKESSQYSKEINSMITGDMTNTDFGKVMKLLSYLGEPPQYLVVLSDMEFDMGSNTSKTETMELFKSKGYNTRIVWWNLNSRNFTSPEMDNDGNIFISGYNPMMLKFLEAGFDAHKFLDKLLMEYKKAIRE